MASDRGGTELLDLTVLHLAKRDVDRRTSVLCLPSWKFGLVAAARKGHWSKPGPQGLNVPGVGR
jgi:hypothetical protein